MQYAVFGSWVRQANASNGQAGPWYWESTLTDLTPEQQASVEAARQEAKVRAEAAREQHRHEGAEAAAALMAEATQVPADTHPYMARKGFGPEVTIFTRGNELLVPYQILRTGELQAVQRITPTGAKFWVGSPTGAGCWIGTPPTAATTRYWVAEGLATAMSVHLATREPTVSVGGVSNALPVIRELRALYPNTLLWLALDADEAGRKAAEKILQEYPQLRSVFPVFPPGKPGTDWDDLRQIAQQEVVRQLVGTPNTTGPGELERLPLTRELSPCAPFPLEALGPVLEGAARSIIRVLQVPPALAAQSLLAVASLAAQAVADVCIDSRRIPIGNFFVTVAESGERKSATDKLALLAVQERQQELVMEHSASMAGFDAELSSYEAARKDLLKTKRGKTVDLEQVREAREKAREAEAKLGAPPERPLLPNLLCGDPTSEGLFKLFQAGQPSLGIFSDEGGRMLGGFALSPDARTHTIAMFSNCWDGAALDRVRGGDGASILYNRRLSMHLMLQPPLAVDFLTTPIYREQGFANRILLVWPESTVGTRSYQDENLLSDAALRFFQQTLRGILHQPFRLRPNTRNELDPLPLTLSPAAKQAWIAYHNETEQAMGPEQPLVTLKGFASKAAEHALRLAGVLTVLNNFTVPEIAVGHMEAAITLMRFYVGEQRRILEGVGEHPDLSLARKILAWAQPLKQVHLSQIYRCGPRGVRDKQTATRICQLLVDHQWFIPVEGGTVIEGIHRKQVWLVQC